MSKKKKTAAEAAREAETASKFNFGSNAWWPQFCRNHPGDAEQIREVIRDFNAGKTAFKSRKAVCRFLVAYFDSVDIRPDTLSRLSEWQR